MNAQETSIRNSALGWVKKSIDDNLLEVESDLKRYIESSEPGLLEGVKQRLGVTQGVLVMVEQYGAAMLTEEMIALVDFIVTDKESKSEQSLEVCCAPYCSYRITWSTFSPGIVISRLRYCRCSMMFVRFETRICFPRNCCFCPTFRCIRTAPKSKGSTMPATRHPVCWPRNCGRYTS